MYLVTGGSGFCGVEIVKYLLKNNQNVRVLDVEPLPEELAHVEYVKADIRDTYKIYKACEGVKKIIHTVAKVPISKAGSEFWKVNVDGTRNVLEACLKNKIEKVVHLSSSAVQLSENNPVDESAPYNPVGLYARSKMEAENICKEYVKKGVHIDIIRPRTVLGSGRLGIFDILFDWISAGKNIYIIGNGTNKIQFLHSRDLASCCYLASLSEGSEIYNIGSKEYAGIREDLQSLIEYARSDSKIISLPVTASIYALRLLDIVHLSPLASWHYLTYHKNFYFSNEKAQRLLNWRPEYGNTEILRVAFDSYINMKKHAGLKFGRSHRRALRQGILRLLRLLS